MSLIGKSIGNYQIKAKLGEGGMGAVYLGEHPLIGKRVAVKVLLEELASKEDIVTRFFNEAKAVNDIGHSNIVDIVDFGKTKNDFGQDIVYFIMEFLDGESLAARLRRTGLAFKETMHVMEQCCSALAASHGKGIVHRDLKPENIYLLPRGNDKNFVKLLDFGIAKLTGDGGQSHKTRTGLVIGTPAYMSPEQCEGKGLIDHRSDIYSLGIVMYELLTGRVPFPGEGFGEILVAHLTKTPEPPSTLNPDITPAIESIVMHSIEKDRNRRFQSMDEFAAAVANPEAHLATYQGLPSPASQSYPGRSGGTMIDDGSATPMRSPTGVQRAVTGQRGPITGQRGPMTASGPRPTTLSGAASETFNGDVPRKSKAPIFAAVAGVLLVAGVGGFLAINKKGGDTTSASMTAPTPPPVAAPKKDETYTIEIKSDPTGAKITRADTGDTGTAPWTFKVKAGDPSFDVVVKLDGYAPQPRTITTDKSGVFLVPLVAMAKPEPASPAPNPVVPVANVEKSSSSHHHSSKSSAPSSKSEGGKDKSASAPAETAPVAAKPEKSEKKGKDDGDDMKLLQPHF
jgi:eukaryotic-like serine/threonine-protein kinase